MSAAAEFASWVEEHLGLRCDSAREWELILSEQLSICGVDTFAAYLERISAASDRRAELERLARRLTVGETYFFRESLQIEALATAVLPELLRARGGARVRILSVGCSSGEEPYSIGITARELLGDAATRLQIIGCDANPASIERARAARYSDWSLRVTPPRARARWFSSARDEHQLADEIRGAVTFHVRNLLDDDAAFWLPGSFDVIFCRNLFIYFSQRKITAALDRFAASLSPDGYLFLGHSETTRGHSGLRVEQIAGAFCHRRVGATRSLPPCGPPESGPRPDPAPLTDAQWVETIDQATRRLEDLSARLRTPPSPPAGGAPSAPLQDLVSLIRDARFADALARIDELKTSEGER